MSVIRTPRLWWVSVVSGMASYIDAAAIVSFGIAIVIYQKALGLSPAEVGALSGALTFGIALGALVGGRLGDRFGRRPVFAFTMVLIAVGAVDLTLAPSFPLLLAGTVLVGLGTGADLPVSLATISEAADDSNRGKMIGFSNILWLAGIIASIVISTFVGNMGRVGGQILYAHIGVVAIIVLIARLTIPESDVWLRARQERASGVATIRADRASVRDLLRKPYAGPFFGLMVFYALLNLAANTAGQFRTYLLVNVAGTDVSTASLLGLVTLPLALLGYVWFMKVADSPARFTYFKAGAVFYVVSLLVPAVFGFSVTTSVISGVLAAVGGSFAFEGIMKVWSQEAFPTLLRTTAQGAIIAVARVLAAVLASVTPVVLASVGANTFYAFLSVAAAVGLITAWAVFRGRAAQNEFDTEGQSDPAVAQLQDAAPSSAPTSRA